VRPFLQPFLFNNGAVLTFEARLPEDRIHCLPAGRKPETTQWQNNEKSKAAPRRKSDCDGAAIGNFGRTEWTAATRATRTQVDANKSLQPNWEDRVILAQAIPLERKSI
jgi:hypothetical protein